MGGCGPPGDVVQCLKARGGTECAGARKFARDFDRGFAPMRLTILEFIDQQRRGIEKKAGAETPKRRCADARKPEFAGIRLNRASGVVGQAETAGNGRKRLNAWLVDSGQWPVLEGWAAAGRPATWSFGART
jgi:hypothetical protein